jgi:hypothetical protein
VDGIAEGLRAPAHSRMPGSPHKAKSEEQLQAEQQARKQRMKEREAQRAKKKTDMRAAEKDQDRGVGDASGGFVPLSVEQTTHDQRARMRVPIPDLEDLERATLLTPFSNAMPLVVDIVLFKGGAFVRAAAAGKRRVAAS